MKLIKKILLTLKNRIIILFAYISPIKKNKICMISYYGSGFNDSPKYIALSLAKTHKQAMIFFGVNHTEINKYKSFKNIVFCDTSSAIWFYHLLTAKVWVDNCRKTIKTKKKNTLYLNTWHGSGLQKRIEVDAIASLDDAYIASAKKDALMTDIMISDSTALTNLYKKSFWYSGLVIETGLPRYAPLFDKTIVNSYKVKKELGIPANNKMILYAPTFRNKNELYCSIINFDRIVDLCNKVFGGTFSFAIKLHPNIAHLDIGFITQKGVLNASFFSDTQELLAATDILISDYSSIIFDFSILCRPAFRLMDDTDVYDRGFYFDIYKYPWPIAKNEKELCENIKNFDAESFKKDIEHFFDFLGFNSSDHPETICASIICDYLSFKNSKKAFLKKVEEKYGK